MTAAFDKHFVTREDVIQAAINAVEDADERFQYQQKFDADRETAFSGFANRGLLGSRSFGQLMRSSQRVEVDPERLKRWIAIAKVLLPIILAFL